MSWNLDQPLGFWATMPGAGPDLVRWHSPWNYVAAQLNPGLRMQATAQATAPVAGDTLCSPLDLLLAAVRAYWHAATQNATFRGALLSAADADIRPAEVGTLPTACADLGVGEPGCTVPRLALLVVRACLRTWVNNQWPLRHPDPGR